MPINSDVAARFIRDGALERSFLADVTARGLPATTAASACALAALHGGSIPGYEPSSTDEAVLTAVANVVTFCTAAG